MADFKTVHHREIAAAAHQMRTSTRDHWNIMLREPLGNPNSPGPETATFITVTMVNGVFHLANAGSMEALKDWKERHKDTPDDAFELPKGLFRPTEALRTDPDAAP